MCLDKVTKKQFKIKKPRKSFKVIAKRDGLWRMGRYHGFGVVIQEGINKIKREGNIQYGDSPSYPAGYHTFKKRKDAEEYKIYLGKETGTVFKVVECPIPAHSLITIGKQEIGYKLLSTYVSNKLIFNAEDLK